MPTTELDDMLTRLQEAEQLLRVPSITGNSEKASKLLIAIARRAPGGGVSQAAMLTVDAISARSRLGRDEQGLDSTVNHALGRLRRGLEEVKQEVVKRAK